MRYWQTNNSLAQTADSVDLSVDDPAGGWVEFADETAYEAAAAALIAAAPAPTPPVTTSLVGNNQSHSTNAAARRVTVVVVAPVGGPVRARPNINGTPVGGGTGPILFDSPADEIVVSTHAGNNDVVIIEEF